jgi:hypothetical protein
VEKPVMKTNTSRNSISSITIWLFLITLIELLVLTPMVQAGLQTNPVPGTKLDITVDVGSIYFLGEKAEFYILVSLSGNPINADIEATLYYEGTVYSKVTNLLNCVDEGLYTISYTIPCNASRGTYTLYVEGCYNICDGKTFDGASLKSYVLSETLNGLEAWLSEIHDDVATIRTDVGIIKISMEGINARLTEIDGRIAVIETKLGTIKTDISNLELILVNIEKNVVTLNSSLGIIQGSIVSIQDNVLI